MGTGKNSEVPGELLNFLLIDCYIFGPPPHNTHTHIYTVCTYTHSHTYIIDVSIYLSIRCRSLMMCPFLVSFVSSLTKLLLVK